MRGGPAGQGGARGLCLSRCVFFFRRGLWGKETLCAFFKNVKLPNFGAFVGDFKGGRLCKGEIYCTAGTGKSFRLQHGHCHAAHAARAHFASHTVNLHSFNLPRLTEADVYMQHSPPRWGLPFFSL